MLRWSVGIAGMLILQTLLVALLFWVFANSAERRRAEDALADQCTILGDLPAEQRAEEIGEMLNADVHRELFLGAFDASGDVVAGNIAAIPKDVRVGGFVETQLTPTQLPGVSSDIVLARLCNLTDGSRILVAKDLDRINTATRIAESAVLVALVPAILFAMTGGLFAGTQATRRFETVRDLGRRITAGDLKERLPVGERPDAFGMICLQINQMLDRIELLMEDVRGVGDDIAHQLRTPLTRLRARIERSLFNAQTPQEFGAAGIDALAEIDLSLTMVSALLRIREIDDHSRRVAFQPVDLSELVRDGVELYQPFADSRSIHLVIENGQSAVIRGDRDLLMEALSNLVDNAVKYAPEGSQVIVRLKGGAHPLIDVVNDGNGFGDAESEAVFRRFYRGRNSDDVQGSGLGLSLVKAITDLHDAKISLGRDERGRIRVSIQFAGAI